jgi:demethylmenaquinone methyltransferase/2-methoxy-6-polyprenyl-1,4-benzoquinol methylase
VSNKIINAPLTPKKVQSLYDFLSSFYEYLTRYESLSKERGVDVADIQLGDTVFEAGFGTGEIVIASAVSVGKDGHVYGIDVSSKMLEKTRKRVKKHELTKRVDLQLGDARKLPYTTGVFDVVFTSYLLDLIDTPAISCVLREFKRVLKPGGRLVVVNMSKGDSRHSTMKLYEWFYSRCPSLFGGCRPVVIEPFLETLGFLHVKRERILAGLVIPSEIVWGDKPK